MAETLQERLARLLMLGAPDEQQMAQDARGAAALRLKQGAAPEGGRMEGPFTEMVSSPQYLFDMTPPGMAANAIRSANEGDYMGAATHAAGVAAPFAGSAMRGLGALMSAFPKSAALGAGGAAMLTSAEAGPQLTAKQQQRLEMQRQGAANALEAEKVRQEQALEGDRARAEMERQNRDDAAAFAGQQRQADVDAQRQEAERVANMPFRERYPTVANALPFAGLAGSFGAPYLARLAQGLKRNSAIGDWESSIDRARSAVTNTDPAALKAAASELKAFQKTPLPEPGMSPVGLAASAFIPTEAGLLPAEMDLATLPEGSPGRQAAKEMLTNPNEWLSRAGVGVLQGTPAAILGSKLPIPMREKNAPVAESQGVIDSAKSLALALQRAQTNARRRSKDK